MENHNKHIWKICILQWSIPQFWEVHEGQLTFHIGVSTLMPVLTTCRVPAPSVSTANSDDGKLSEVL